MVWTWIINEVTSFLTWIINGFPAPTVPAWLSSIQTNVSSVVNFVNHLSAWIPSQLLIDVVTAYGVTLGIAVTIKIIRWVQSSLTGGGGIG